ncbi:SpoIIE family protein phosphatase [Leptospira sp. GIMC2001]|uniref:SpoIIE family protein phosphatase n=1 Tax=Leptospira sp. GIMC2001 TaxID=1513297 RepID=UPI00234B573D|nr:SpoIIE family protein phosphatase [Leptospira sp. GIMC2001]WCL49973.1 SpoIIE family protein phosphatase [Leptospira sp. GIMC2001]
MSIRYKIFLILGASQVLLLAALTLTFSILIVNVKNEPQNQRAVDLARNFQRELAHKDENLRLLLTELLNNPSTADILKRGMSDRSLLIANQDKLKEIMARYDLNIFELGDRKGKVHYRVHRPNDFGDDKSNQPLIQSALSKKSKSTLETGHSGLGFRVTAPLDNLGTILIGQVVNSEFAETISGKESVHLAVFEGKNLLTASNEIIEKFLNHHKNKTLNSHSRVDWNGIPFYYVEVPFEDRGMSSLDLSFKILIDEKELETASQKIWLIFFIVAVLVFGAIFFISYLFSRDIVNAVKALNSAMKNIDLSLHDDLPMDRKDEIGQMGAVFQDMKKDLYQHQNNLEDMVAKKTLELQNTLEEIRTIKEQQDGDYFLTSLLIKPLSGGSYKSDNLHVETIERQKKVFQFRNRRSEIGGDLSVIQTIYLKGKRYTVYLNADAMGKSIQGAGGALVMGTVFKSVITRTQQVQAMQDRHPERWLKDCFTELHDVFISFDGSMLLSAVIGLIDDETGTMYYINAEHPWIVLYRDGKAEFIENELLLRKIGFTESEFAKNEFYIKVFQLNPDDVIIVGSDGRDDILMGESTLGERIINEDEREFLSRVEEGKGELEAIEKAILNKGELTDDFSLIRIAYKSKQSLINGNSEIDPESFLDSVKIGIKFFKEGNIDMAIASLEEALVLQPENFYCMRELAKLYIKTKDFEKATYLCEKYSNLRPNDTDFLYYIAYAYKQKKNYSLAADYGERFRLRDPYNSKNLILLAEIYMHLGKHSRAAELLGFLEEFDAENAKLIRLKSFLQSKNLVT